MKTELGGLKGYEDLTVEINHDLLDKAIYETKTGLSKAENFENDVKTIDKTRVVFSLGLFCFGFVLYVLGFIAFVVKEERLVLGFGISL